MARRYDSEAVRNRVLSTSVRLFLERGYHGTTMAAILKEADVSSSSFQNVFGNKDGVMYELMKLMFSEQFSAADSAAALLGPNASPAFAYALETSVQLTIAELSEIIRDLYLQAYASERSLEYIRRNTAKHLQKFFQQYNPSFDEEDFYQIDIGTSGLMLGFMLRPCSDDFPLDVKIERYLQMSLSALNVPAEERTTIIEGIKQQDLRSIAKAAVKQLFDVLSDTFDLELQAQIFGERVRQGRVCRIAGRKAQICCPPAGRQDRHAAACGYRIPITPSSGMAKPDGPSVSLNGVGVALLWCDGTRLTSVPLIAQLPLPAA